MLSISLFLDSSQTQILFMREPSPIIRLSILYLEDIHRRECKIFHLPEMRDGSAYRQTMVLLIYSGWMIIILIQTQSLER